MTRIVIATQNPGKVRELSDMIQRSALSNRGFEIIGLGDLDETFPEPDENGSTFLDNATIKARAYAKMTGYPCLADDSGLEIDALDNRPGVVSSHYAWDGQTSGEPSTLTRPQRDERNIDRVLSELDPVEPEDRTARFVCAMVLADPSGHILATSLGAFEGRIGLPIDHPHTIPGDSVPRGHHGFGYDPIFLVGPDFIRTSAELDPDEKNAISHRAEALEDMIRRIETLDL